MADGDWFSQLGQMFGGGQQPQPQAGAPPQAPQNPYGIPDELMQQARMQAFGNVGAQLLSAAQPQSRDQRAATIGRIGEAANPQQYLNQAQQMMLRNVQLREAQRKAHENEVRAEAIKTPEFRDAFKKLSGHDLTPALAAVLGNDGLDAVAKTLVTTDPEEKRLRMQNLRQQVEMAGYTLGIGQTRFGANNQPLASNETGLLTDEQLMPRLGLALSGNNQEAYRGYSFKDPNRARLDKLIAAARAGDLPQDMVERATQMGKDYIQNAVKVAGYRAGAVEQGKRAGVLTQAGAVLDTFVDNAKQAAADLGPEMSKYPTYNSIIQAYLTGTGDPRVLELGQALNSVVNAYARATGGSHGGTVHDKTEAIANLDKKYTVAQINAVLDFMKKEIHSEKGAYRKAAQELDELFSDPVAEPAAPGVGAPGVPASAATPGVRGRVNPDGTFTRY